jgi:uncharacterized protein (DUF4415 family)
MVIVWEDPKRLSNLARHGLDFADLNGDFFLSSLVVPAKDGRHMAIQPQGKEPPMTRKTISDAEEARIQAMIASDADAPEATDEQLAQARPFADAFPALADAIRKGGRPRAGRPKLAVSIRLDQDVVERFKASGPGWQSRMNEALRKVAGL